MDENFHAFDWHRLFVGDAPLLFLVEIIVRTIIMYGYTIILLRVLGKRGMGQLSSLELAIIIGFGTAVGDPMIYENIPVTYGIVAITVIALLQIGLEKFNNSNKKVEKIMDGEPNLVIDDGVMLHDNMKKDNISKEDLFRFLRLKEVTHLGQVNKAIFETSGEMSIFLHRADQIKPGLSVLPVSMTKKETIGLDSKIKEESVYICTHCGNRQHFKKDEVVTLCSQCQGDKWVNAN